MLLATLPLDILSGDMCCVSKQGRQLVTNVMIGTMQRETEKKETEMDMLIVGINESQDLWKRVEIVAKVGSSRKHF